MTVDDCTEHDRGRGALVVALEYAGATVEPTTGAMRRPLLEHAFDTTTGRLVGSGSHHPRIGFTCPERGWPEPPQLDRCEICVRTVAGLIDDLVATLVERATHDATIWFTEEDDPGNVWLYPDEPV